ncbi:MAG: 3-dehydroquinate synthase [Bacteroidales bacterium]
MEKITIQGKTGVSRILVGESLPALSRYIPATGVFIITDENVAGHYHSEFPDFPVYIVEPGEKSKDFAVMEKIWHWLLDQGADRSSFIVGIGGGVVCDLAGFVASTFMRGIPFGFVATSLLAQVDASVGGKNGVNLGGYKNIIGTFTQPEFVICDTSMLKTLPDNEFRNGMAEVIKHALIRDADKFEFLKSNRNAIMNREREAINHIVNRSVKIKATIVQADELERGERRILNFGHTWGHAVEKENKIPHGQAVSVGMAFAAGLSKHLGYLKEKDYNDILVLLHDYRLPLNIELDKNQVFDTLLKDKKKEKNHMNFVLLKTIGDAFVKEMDTKVIKDFCMSF